MNVVQRNAGTLSMSEEIRIRKCFLAGDLTTRTLLAELRTQLAQLETSTTDQENVELILAEALNNVFEHAYSGQPGPVEMLIAVKSDGIDCLVCDKGKTMPFGKVPEPALPPVDEPETLPEGGFGWYIIRCLSADLHYIRSDGWNRLSFRIPFDQGH